MKIKRFVADDMRTVLRKVSETLGSDAVILSNNRIDEGIEIVAAIDYDESLINEPNKAQVTKKENPFIKDDEELSRTHIEQRNRQAALDDVRYARNIPSAPRIDVKEIAKQFQSTVSSSASTNQKNNEHLWTEEPAFMEMQSELKSLRGLLVNQLSSLSWGNEVQYHPLRSRLLQRLMSLGLSPKLSKDIAAKVNEEKDFEHNWRLALGELAHRIPVGENEIFDNGGVVALVGATGVGKTTTIAKLAARYTLKHGPHRVALITTDNYRVAAQEQLRSYARIMGIPMCIAGDADSLREALDTLHDKELILIDTAGMSQRDMMLNKQFAMLQAEGLPVIKTYLTLATNCQRGVLTETGNKFKEMNLAGCILTKVDETTSMGGALTVAVENNLPISYFCDGQQVPEDIHLARAHSIVSRSVSVMQHMVSSNVYDEATSLTIGGMVANANG
ncbi:MAG: flagellar biosynthesis protein FlhF [Gammaproteobacteria bacterium]|nr:flagellar biosynthesis protein FlhF [Gammaproteobacteria bacterium]